MCLALGWQDGLEILLNAGFPPENALELAIKADDFVSFHFLLPHTSFIDYTWAGVPFNRVFNHIHQIIDSEAYVPYIVQEFTSRRVNHNSHSGSGEQAIPGQEKLLSSRTVANE